MRAVKSRQGTTDSQTENVIKTRRLGDQVCDEFADGYFVVTTLSDPIRLSDQTAAGAEVLRRHFMNIEEKNKSALR